MTFTLTKSLTFAQAGSILLAKTQRAQSVFYRRLMKKVKKVTKKPLVKIFFKLNAALEKSLKKIMRALHLIENTALFKLTALCAIVLVKTVRQDGLKFTVLITSLGYTAWCYFI
jgi:hypothetical protein